VKHYVVRTPGIVRAFADRGDFAAHVRRYRAQALGRFAFQRRNLRRKGWEEVRFPQYLRDSAKRWAKRTDRIGDGITWGDWYISEAAIQRGL
jgi:hypothetical protein